MIERNRKRLFVFLFLILGIESRIRLFEMIDKMIEVKINRKLNFLFVNIMLKVRYFISFYYVLKICYSFNIIIIVL